MVEEEGCVGLFELGVVLLLGVELGVELGVGLGVGLGVELNPDKMGSTS